MAEQHASNNLNVKKQNHQDSKCKSAGYRNDDGKRCCDVKIDVFVFHSTPAFSKMDGICFCQN